MVPAVHKLKHTPLINIEWSQDRMARALGGWAKESLRLNKEQLEIAEVFGGCVSEIFARQRMESWLGHHDRRSFAAQGEVSATGDCVLKDPLPKARFGASGSALLETSVDCRFGAGVGEEQMFDDLLNAPLSSWRLRAELSLSRVQSTEGRYDLSLELMQGDIHGGKFTLHRLRDRTRIFRAII
jgi:hypothetical protein